MSRTFESNPELFPCGPYMPNNRDDMFTLGFLEDEDTQYISLLSGSNLILSSSEGDIQSTSLSSFIDVDTDTQYTFLKKDEPVPIEQLIGEGTNSFFIEGIRIETTNLNIGPSGITSGTISINGEIAPITTTGNTFTDSAGNVLSILSFPNSDYVLVELLTVLPYSVTLSGTDGVESSINLFECLSSVFLDDTDTVVTYTQILNGTVLSLSGSNGDLFDTDLSSFLDDTDTNTSYTLSLNGTELNLVGSDGTNNPISLSSFLDDTDTDSNVTYTQELNGTILSLSGSDGSIFNTELSSFLDNVDTNTSYTLNLNGTNLNLNGSDGSINIVNLSSFLDDTDSNVIYTQSLNGTLLSLSGSDGNVFNTELSSFLDDTDSNTIYSQILNGSILSLSGSDGSVIDTNLSSFLDDTIVTYTLSSDGVNNITLLGSDGSVGNALVNLDLDTTVTYTQLLGGPNNDVLTLSGSDGSIIDTNLSSFLDDTDTTYSLSSDGVGTVSLIDSDGISQLISINLDTDTNTTYSLSSDGINNIVLVGSDGSTNPVNVNLDTDTVYDISISGNVVSLSSSDNITQTIIIPDEDTTYTHLLSGSNNDMLILSGSDGSLISTDLSAFLDNVNTNTTYNLSSDGVNTISLSSSDGSINLVNINLDTDTAGSLSSNGDNTSTVSFPDGTTGCFIECPPAGIADGARPTHVGGGVVWQVPDADAEYDFSFSRVGDDLVLSVTDTTGTNSLNGTNTFNESIQGVFTDNDTQDTSVFSGSVNSGLVNLSHEAGGVTTPVQFPLGVSAISTTNLPNGATQINYIDGAGVLQVAGVIPAAAEDDDSGNVTQVTNPDGSITSSHIPSGLSWTTSPVSQGGFSYDANTGVTTETDSNGVVRTTDTNVFNSAGDEGGAITSPTSTVVGPTEEAAIKQTANNLRGWRRYREGAEITTADSVDSTVDWTRSGNTAVAVNEANVTMSATENFVAASGRVGAVEVNGVGSSVISSEGVRWTSTGHLNSIVASQSVDDDNRNGNFNFAAASLNITLGQTGCAIVASTAADMWRGNQGFIAGSDTVTAGAPGSGGFRQGAIVGCLEVTDDGSGFLQRSGAVNSQQISFQNGSHSTSGGVFARNITFEGGAGATRAAVGSSTTTFLQPTSANPGNQGVIGVGRATNNGVTVPSIMGTGGDAAFAGGRGIQSNLTCTLSTDRIQLHPLGFDRDGNEESPGGAPLVTPPLASSGDGTSLLYQKRVGGVFRPHAMASDGTEVSLANWHPAVAQALIENGAEDIVLDPTANLGFKCNSLTGNLTAVFGQSYFRVNTDGEGSVLNGQVSGETLKALIEAFGKEGTLESRFADQNQKWKVEHDDNQNTLADCATKALARIETLTELQGNLSEEDEQYEEKLQSIEAEMSELKESASFEATKWEDRTLEKDFPHLLAGLGK